MIIAIYFCGLKTASILFDKNVIMSYWEDIGIKIREVKPGDKGIGHICLDNGQDFYRLNDYDFWTPCLGTDEEKKPYTGGNKKAYYSIDDYDNKYCAKGEYELVHYYNNAIEGEYDSLAESVSSHLKGIGKYKIDVNYEFSGYLLMYFYKGNGLLTKLKNIFLIIKNFNHVFSIKYSYIISGYIVNIIESINKLKIYQILYKYLYKFYNNKYYMLYNINNKDNNINGDIFNYVPKHMKSNHDFMLKYIYHDYKIFEHINDDLLNKTFILDVLKINPNVYCILNNDMKNYKLFLKTTLYSINKSCFSDKVDKNRIFEAIPDKLKNDVEIKDIINEIEESKIPAQIPIDIIYTKNII